MVSFMMDGILEYLSMVDRNTHRAPKYGQTLVTLTEAVCGYNVDVGDVEYHACSRAVILLEEMGLVYVDRAHQRTKHKANIILSVRLHPNYA
jgi:hypothetical protein